MKRLFIIANWKANKITPQAKAWLAEISNLKSQISNTTNKEIIVCPSFTLLNEAKSLITNYQLPITLGAQDISLYDEGSYTGEVNGKQIKEFADYVIIGHSERREHFLESDELLVRKVSMAKKYGIDPIFCVQDENTPVPKNVEIVAYEPVFAIGTGNPDTAENADKVADEIKKKNETIKYVLYGGSINSKNVKSFTQMPNIDGVLVGSASLDPGEFLEIIKNA